MAQEGEMIPVTILCGGTGTRLREQTELIPKPLIPIGPYPMVVHIMKIYARYGFKDFILALGYRQEQFKQYFSHIDILNNDVTITPGMPIKYHHPIDYDWKVTLVDTGAESIKSQRLQRIQKYVVGSTFFMTYGDAVTDINLLDLLAYHRSHGKIATVTGIHPTSRFGEIKYDDIGHVIEFSEKPQDGCITSGGFFVFEQRIFEHLYDGYDLEECTLVKLAEMGELMIYKHNGFWKCMDNLKEMGELQQMWDTDNAPWAIRR